MRIVIATLLNFFAINLYAECDFEYVPKLELFYSPYCYYSLKVINYLKSIHKEVPLKNVMQDPELRQELIEKGGKAQIPCLLIDDTALYESDLIIRFLEENKDCLYDEPEETQADLKVQPE